MGIFTDFYVADQPELEAAFSWIGSGPAGDPPKFDEDDPEASTDAINEWLEEQPVGEPSETERSRMEAFDRLDTRV
jgi:hypothetical protein